MAREGLLPSLRLYRSELEALVAKMKELIKGSNDVVIAATIDGREVRQFSKDFFSRIGLPQYVTQMSLSLVDGRQPISSTINVHLAIRGASGFFIQSDNGLLVSGGHSELSSFFERFANPILVFYQRHGLNGNTLLLLVAVSLLPEFPLISRALILGVAITLMLLFVRLHRQLNSTKIYLDHGVTRGVLPKALPSIVSALVVAVITGLLAWAYSAATLDNLRRLGSFLRVQ